MKKFKASFALAALLSLFAGGCESRTGDAPRPVSVLVLCTGNTCRSQMAHGFLESFDPELEVRSGGVEPAKRINPKAEKAMKDAGIDISSHKPTGVESYTDRDWDFVITVCGHANETCPDFRGRVGRRIHMPFDDPSHAKGSDEFVWSEFERVREEIRKAFKALYLKEMLPLKEKRKAAAKLTSANGA